MQNLSELFEKFIHENGYKILISSIIILIGMTILKKSNKIFAIFYNHINVTPSEFNFFNSGIKTLIYFAMFSLVSSQFELNIWSTIASISASLVAASVIFKDNVSNFVAGMSILVNKILHINDEVQIENYKGRVIKIGAICTYLVTKDDKTIIIPNSKVLSDTIIRDSEWDLVNVNLTIKISNKNTQLCKKEKQRIKNKIEKFILFKNNCTSGDCPPSIIFRSSRQIFCTISAYMQKNNEEKFKEAVNNLLLEESEKYHVEITENDNLHD